MKPFKIVLFLLAFGLTSLSFCQDVFTTKTGEKYHQESCRYLSKSKYRVDLKDAIQYGYDPCSVCKPPTRTSSGNRQASNFSSNQSSSRASIAQAQLRSVLVELKQAIGVNGKQQIPTEGVISINIYFIKENRKLFKYYSNSFV